MTALCAAILLIAVWFIVVTQTGRDRSTAGCHNITPFICLPNERTQP